MAESLIGPTLPEMARRLDITISDGDSNIGYALTVSSLCTVIGSFVFGLVLDKYIYIDFMISACVNNLLLVLLYCLIHVLAFRYCLLNPFLTYL